MDHQAGLSLVARMTPKTRERNSQGICSWHYFSLLCASSPAASSMHGVRKLPKEDLEEVVAMEDLVVEEMTTIPLPLIIHDHLRGQRNPRGLQLQAQGRAQAVEHNSIRHGGLVFGLAQLLEPRQDTLQEEVDALSLHHHQPDQRLAVDGSAEEEMVVMRQLDRHHLHQGPTALQARVIPPRDTRALASEAPVDANG